jgi:hypothetical protein
VVLVGSSRWQVIANGVATVSQSSLELVAGTSCPLPLSACSSAGISTTLLQLGQPTINSCGPAAKGGGFNIALTAALGGAPNGFQVRAWRWVSSNQVIQSPSPAVCVLSWRIAAAQACLH